MDSHIQVFPQTESEESDSEALCGGLALLAGAAGILARIPPTLAHSSRLLIVDGVGLHEVLVGVVCGRCMFLLLRHRHNYGGTRAGVIPRPNQGPCWAVLNSLCLCLGCIRRGRPG